MASKFGDRLRNLRLGKGLGQREAAEKAGIDSAYLNRLETGVQAPPNPKNKPQHAERLISALAALYGNGLSEENDIIGELSALATLPDDTPPQTLVGLTNHFKRQIQSRRKK